MTSKAANNAIVREATRVCLAVFVVGALARPAMAQPWPGYPIQGTAAPGGPVTTNHTPLIPGAPTAPAFSAPAQGQPPPVGDGPTPAPEIPGMPGSPVAPPSMVDVPPVMGNDIDDVNAAVAPYLVPPPSTPGTDPTNLNGSSGGVGLTVDTGTIDGTNSQGVLAAPAARGNINAGGGIPDLGAPTTRWAAQRSYDYGRNQNVVNNNASGYDQFAWPLPQVPNIKMQPVQSQDGPRTLNTAQLETPIRNEFTQGNFPQAQQTTDLWGGRVQFNANYHQNETIAPY